MLDPLTFAIVFTIYVFVYPLIPYLVEDAAPTVVESAAPAAANTSEIAVNTALPAVKAFPLTFFGWDVIPALAVTAFVVALFVTIAGYPVLEAPQRNQTNFQQAATAVMEKITDLHNELMFFLVVIVVFVSALLFSEVYEYRKEAKSLPRVGFTHQTLLEIVWTFIPAGILILIALPSFSLLYSIDELTKPKISTKVLGSQWYWNYETTDMLKGKEVAFASYMTNEKELPKGALRLLEVDNRLRIPVRTTTRLIITATDVLHSWAVPALGVKMDACPGRLNQASLFVNRAGTYYGQCSELCGVNHSFMPIVVDAITPAQYRRWLTTTATTAITLAMLRP